MAPKTNTQDIIKETAQDLLHKLNVEASVSVSEAEEGYSLNIQTPESGLLIGYHGEVINSLQVLLAIIVYKKLKVWVRIIVDVGDYRLKREETIKRMALDKAEEVKRTGQSATLNSLSPLERRIVHMTLAKDSDVYSESEGEGNNRRLTIKPKAQ